MTPGLYVEFVIPRDDPNFDGDAFGDTFREHHWATYGGQAYVHARAQVDWLEHDGEGGVYAQFVGVQDHVYMSDESLPVWKVVTE